MALTTLVTTSPAGAQAAAGFRVQSEWLGCLVLSGAAGTAAAVPHSLAHRRLSRHRLTWKLGFQCG